MEGYEVAASYLTRWKALEKSFGSAFSCEDS